MDLDRTTDIKMLSMGPYIVWLLGSTTHGCRCLSSGTAGTGHTPPMLRRPYQRQHLNNKRSTTIQTPQDPPVRGISGLFDESVVGGPVREQRIIPHILDVVVVVSQSAPHPAFTQKMPFKGHRHHRRQRVQSSLTRLTSLTTLQQMPGMNPIGQGVVPTGPPGCVVLVLSRGGYRQTTQARVTPTPMPRRNYLPRKKRNQRRPYQRTYRSWR